MLVQPGALKRGVIILYVTILTLFTYHFALIFNPDQLDPIQPIILLSMVVLGGLITPGAYALNKCSYTDENKHLWRNVRNILLLSLVGIVIAIVSIFLGIYFVEDGGRAVALVGLVVGSLWAWFSGYKVYEPFMELIGSDNIPDSRV